MASVREAVVAIYGGPIPSLKQMKIDVNGDTLTESEKKLVLAYLKALTSQDASWS